MKKYHVRFFIWILFLLILSQGKLTALGLISGQKEKKLGNEILRKISNHTPIIDDLLWQAYMNQLANFLIGFSSSPAEKIQIYIADSDVINAFALPGNIIVINSALILKTQNEGQLAAVLSHEISHVIQKHFQRIYQAYSEQILLNGAALIAAILVGGAVSHEVVQAGVLSSMAFSTQNMIRYTRAHEYEADRIGNRILVKAGYKKDAMSQFLALLPKGPYHQALEPLLTHPTVIKRQTDAWSLDKTKGKNYQIASRLDYALLKINLSVNSKKNNVIDDLKNKHPLDVLANYKLGLIALNNKNLDQANNNLLQAWRQANNNLIIGLSYLDVLIKLNDQKKAEQLIDTLSLTYPSSLALKLKKADYYISFNQLKKAQFYLYSLISQYPKEPLGYQKLAIVFKQLKNNGAMHYYLASYYYYQGALSYALSQLKLAITNLPETSRNYKEALVKEAKWQRQWLSQ